jgi:hypothetical protein
VCPVSAGTTFMNHHMTIEHYRRKAEGLLWQAVDALGSKKQELIRQAAACLAFARRHFEELKEPYVGPVEAESSYDVRFHQVRQLIKRALDEPTPDGLANFLDFTTGFRRLGVWNARMAYIQRPGARVIASEYEWKTMGRYVLPDAVPIMILWPFSPIRFVYELEDTGPPVDRGSINDPFAVDGELQPRVFASLVASLKAQKTFRIKGTSKNGDFRRFVRV